MRTSFIHISGHLSSISADIFHPYQVAPADLSLSLAPDIMNDLRKHDCMRIIKTWTNSWATSHRMHECTLLPCLFGCEGREDSLNHYVMCPLLLGLLELIKPETSVWPLVRWGLKQPTRESLLSVACVFSSYHACKRRVRCFQWGTDSFNSMHISAECRKLVHDEFLSVFCSALMVG